MPQVAFYRVITDKTNLVLSANASHATLHFDGTDDMVLTSEARPVLCFQFDPSSDADLRFYVSITKPNGDYETIGETWTLRDGTARFTMEPIDPTLVSEGATRSASMRTTSSRDRSRSATSS